MADSAAVLIAVVIIVPLLALLIYAAFRNLFTSAKNPKVAVEGELARRKVPPETGRSHPDPLPKPQATDPVAAMMAEFQAQAKRSDDAHKARIRAHVERKIPPISDDGRATIERARQARLAIKHIFPPRLPQRSMSYFGGIFTFGCLWY